MPFWYGVYWPRRSVRRSARFRFSTTSAWVAEQPGDKHDLRPHPHIGLATVTYVLDGAITHSDIRGSVQDMEPGAINWVTAGRGIVHSERRPARFKDA